MIGSCKHAGRAQYKTFATGTGPHVIWYHYLKQQVACIENGIPGTTYYYTYDKLDINS